MTEGTHKGLLIALSALWIALVSGYMAWGAINHAGLYRWLAELQVAQTGGYYPRWTGILPALLLCMPAIWFLRRVADQAAAAEPPDRTADAQRIGRTARIMATVGIVAGIVGVGTFVFAQGLPDGSEAALDYNFAVIGTGAPVPAHKVRIRGSADPAATTGVSESGGGGERATLYAGFRPDGAEAKDAPFNLFIERSLGSTADAAATQAFLPDQDGYLVENGLPALALADLEARGIAVARPHYVLRPGGEGPRMPYYVAAALCALVAAFCLIAAIVGVVRARARMVGS